MRTSSSLLLLPFLASSSLALPAKRNEVHVKRIHHQRAGAPLPETVSTKTTAAPPSSSSYTGIPIASTSSSVADSLSPFDGSSSNSTTSPSNSTGLDSVNPNPGNVSSETLSSLLAQTTAFQSFTFTDYVSPSTSSSPSSAVVTGSSEDDDGGDMGSASSGGDAWSQAASAAQAYAQSMMGSVLPTLTLEVILEPTQVRSCHTLSVSMVKR